VSAFAVTDSLYTYLSSVNDYDSGNFIDLGWMIAYAVIILAAAGAANRRLNVDSFRHDEDHAIPVRQSLALNGALIPVGVMLFAGHDDLLVAGFLVLVALAFGSHLLTHFEIARLNRDLSDLAEALNSRVRTQRVEAVLERNQRVRTPEREPARAGPESWPEDNFSGPPSRH
jgi:hypothetical protein